MSTDRRLPRRGAFLVPLTVVLGTLAACTQAVPPDGAPSSSASPSDGRSTRPATPESSAAQASGSRPTTFGALPSGASGTLSTSVPSVANAATSDSSSTPVAPSASPARPTPTAPTEIRTVPSRRTSYPVQVWAQVQSTSCASAADGEVALFFQTHPCTGMTRRLATTTVDNRAVAFVQTVVQFSDTDTAYAFQRAVRQPDAGSITDLLHDGYRFPRGPAAVPGAVTSVALVQAGTVTLVEAWYEGGSTPAGDPGLSAMAEALLARL